MFGHRCVFYEEPATGAVAHQAKAGGADNHPNTKEGSNFKIDWAVDGNGTPADLDQIDFVKITTAVNQDAGQMGEISTEVTTVENLHFKK